jgi:FMN phosphatase YigB (HAD superfamily)
MSKKIAGIISDSGYVLYDDTPGKLANHEAVRRLYEIGYDDFIQRLGPYRRRAQQDPDYSGEDALRSLSRELGIDADDVLAVRRSLKQARALRDGVRETLAEIRRRGLPFVILSDTYRTADQLREKYEKELGLADVVTGFITSKDMGLRKPAPGMYEAACRRVAAALPEPAPGCSEVAFLGHDLDELEGAHRFGLRPLAVYFRGRRDEIPFIPERDILSDFAGLLRLEFSHPARRPTPPSPVQ